MIKNRSKENGHPRKHRMIPEQEARRQIDAQLSGSGWIVQNREEANRSAGLGVAIREFKLASGHGFADYLLFVDGKAVGALEAKKVGFRLSGAEVQVKKYADGLPNLPSPQALAPKPHVQRHECSGWPFASSGGAAICRTQLDHR